MTRRNRTPEDLRVKGLAALQKALGTVDAIRFLHQFYQGQGDYTAERNEALGDLTLDQILNASKQGRQSKLKKRKSKEKSSSR
jgi:hypothetical protein